MVYKKVRRHGLQLTDKRKAKRRGGEIAQGKAKDAGGLTPAKDNNAASRDCCRKLG